MISSYLMKFLVSYLFMWSKNTHFKFCGVSVHPKTVFLLSFITVAFKSYPVVHICTR